jgi:hypothetical protein
MAFIPGTGVIQVAPEDSQEWDQMSQDIVERLDVIRDQLPQDVVFGKTMEEIAGNSGSPTAGNSWETLAVYLPAGDAREDRTSYFGTMGFYPRKAIVRGLTGAVSIEEPDSRVISP